MTSGFETLLGIPSVYVGERRTNKTRVADADFDLFIKRLKDMEVVEEVESGSAQDEECPSGVPTSILGAEADKTCGPISKRPTINPAPVADVVIERFVPSASSSFGQFSPIAAQTGVVSEANSDGGETSASGPVNAADTPVSKSLFRSKLRHHAS